MLNFRIDKSNLTISGRILTVHCIINIDGVESAPLKCELTREFGKPKFSSHFPEPVIYLNKARLDSSENVKNLLQYLESQLSSELDLLRKSMVELDRQNLARLLKKSKLEDSRSYQLDTSPRYGDDYYDSIHGMESRKNERWNRTSNYEPKWN